MNKFFATFVDNNQIASFGDDDVHHIVKVLRMQVNDELIVNYNKQKYLATLISLKPLKAKLKKQLVCDVNNNYELNVYCASIKPAHIEIAIIKATELNVNNFYIFKSAYSQNNIKHHLERYEKIMLNAAKQSNRNELMKIQILDNWKIVTDNLNQNDINLIADFQKQTFNQNILKKIDHPKIGLIIGPEGGFNQDDLLALDVKNKYIINLTKTILRTETAVIYLVSIISYLMNC